MRRAVHCHESGAAGRQVAQGHDGGRRCLQSPDLVHGGHGELAGVPQVLVAGRGSLTGHPGAIEHACAHAGTIAFCLPPEDGTPVITSVASLFW